MEAEQNQAVPSMTVPSGAVVSEVKSPKAPRSSLSMLVLGVVIGLVFVGLVGGVFGVAYVLLRDDGEDVTDDEEISETEDDESDDEDSDGESDDSGGDDADGDDDDLLDDAGSDDEDSDDDSGDEEPVLSEATDGDSWTFPSGLFDGEYIYERFICDGYAGMDPDYYFMDVEYPSYVSMTTDWRGVGSLGECDLQFSYGTSMMRLQFNVGEAYPVNLEPGFEPILTVGSETLQKTAMELNDGFYSYSYGAAIADADCDGGEMFPELTAPCASPIHPFLPGATMVYVMIPETTGASERGDIVDLFDDLVTRLHGAEN